MGEGRGNFLAVSYTHLDVYKRQAVLAVGDDIGRHVAAAGRVLNVPEPEIPQVLRADEGKERLGGGGGVGGDVGGLGFLAVPEGDVYKRQQ